MNGIIDRMFTATCAETEEHLSEHLEGELRGVRRWRVLRHLGHCEDCRSVLASLARTVELLRSLGRSEQARTSLSSAPSHSVADAVLDRVRREAPAKGHP